MKENKKGYPLCQRLLSFAMAAVLVFGILPVQTRAAAEAEAYLVDHTTTVADPDTISRPVDVYGTDTEHAGKVTVGKSVSDTAVTLTSGDASRTFTPGTDNFIVTVSQAAQIVGVASESSAPVDVVFVLDTSGSMGTNNTSRPTGRAEAMVEAANIAIASLMAANEYNRVGVVAFSGQGAGGGTSNNAAANVLSPLAHYTGEPAANHLRWVSSNGNEPSNSGTETGIGTSYNYIQGRGTDAGRRNGGNGGTNIHAGVALGAKMLTSASTTELVDGKQVTRMPFLVVLSDGQPTYSASNAEWYDPSMTSQQGPGSGAYSGNGFLPALTAAYYKGKITEHYYGDTASEKNRCYIYTIGVGLDSLSGDSAALAQITMDPATYTAGDYAANNAASYWNYGNTYNDNTKNAAHGWKTYWENYQKETAADFGVEINAGEWKYVWTGEGEEGTGEPEEPNQRDYMGSNGRWDRGEWDAYQDAREEYEDAYDAWYADNYTRTFVESLYTITAKTIEDTKKYVNGVGYDGGIAYNDDYFKANETSEITAAFNKALQEIQLKAMSSPTHVDATYGEDFSGYVTFTDPIGEYMEVKDMYGVLADGYWFRGQSFAEKIENWGDDAEFKTHFTKVLQERCKITGSTMDVDAFVAQIRGSSNQAYYNSPSDYDNSFVWWGNGFTSAGEEDEQVQFLSFADNDSIEYIEQQKAAGKIPAAADYVCRSYYFYGAAGGAVEDPNLEYLHFVIRVQRSLKAPYQQTVVISAPASLLSVEKVMITETKDAAGNITYSAAVTEAEPARVVYEVGLRSDINAFNVEQILARDAKAAVDAYDYAGEVTNTGANANYDAATGTYSFYTNDWNRGAAEDSHHRPMAKATFDAAADNSFYTYTEDTPIYVRDGDAYRLYTGTQKPVGSGYYYARTVYDWTGSALTNGAYAAAKRTVYVPITIPQTDRVVASGDNWVISKGVYKASSLVSADEDVIKSANNTGTSVIVVHPHRTESETNSHYTVLLGNNGKLSLKAADTKSVMINAAAGAAIRNDDGKVVMVGDVLTYTIKVINGESTAADAAVTDTIPTGTVYVENSATEGGTYDAVNKVINWNIEDIPAGQYVEVSFQVKVTEAALTGDLDVVSIDNAASVTLANGFSYTTNTTSNPPEGKKAVDTNGNAITGSVDIPDVLVYRIRWHNDTNAVSTVTVSDVIPTGTTYVDNSASHNGVYDAAAKTITWTIANVQPGTSGVVSFRVNVNAAAGTVIENGANIKIGSNDPRVTNKTTVNVAKGDLMLSKAVVANGYNAAAGQSFTLNITEIGLGLNGKFNVSSEGANDSGIGQIEFKNGVATLTIYDGETVTIHGITAGAIISVTEAHKAGFTAQYTTAAGTSASEGRVTITTDTENPASVAVKNTYSPAAVTFALKGTKTLQTTLPLQDTTFGFVAQPCSENGEITANGKPLTGEVTVSGANKTADIIFAPEVFSAAGVYHYLISEINGGVTGIAYAQNQYLLTVAVSDNGSGVLQAAATLKQRENDNSSFGSEVVYTDTGVAFTNTYVPKETQLTLEATKVLNGRDLKAGEFSFVVTEEVDGETVVVSTGTNDAAGKVTFRPITYTATGDHAYTITEVNSGGKGMTYSNASLGVTVAVTDNNGQLVAAPTYPTGGVVFENTFTPDGITVVLEAKKLLDNQSGDSSRVLKEKEFNFVVKDAALNPVATGSNTDTDHDGVYDNIAFTPIGYTVSDAGKTYTYTISEVIPDISYDPYMDYDERAFTVSVTVSYDSENGTLGYQIQYNDVPQGETVPVFTNIQYPSFKEVTPKGKKETLDTNGSTAQLPTGATFAFTIIDAATGLEAGVGVGSANGEFLFSKLIYNQAGEYDYWIKETHAGMESHGIKYDDAVYLMKIVVTHVDGKLEVSEPAYFALAEGVDPANATVNDYTVSVNVPSFKNEYGAKGQISLVAKKVLSGNRALQAGDFAFRLVRQDNGHEITGIVDDSGKVTFATLYYDLTEFTGEATTKTIHYKMSEVISATGKIPGVAYDESVHDVYITITHNNSDGTISAKVTDQDGNVLVKDNNALEPNDSNVTFTNSYTAAGTTAEIKAVKTLTGRTLNNGEFSFELFHIDDAAGKENLVATTANAADGRIIFNRTYASTVLPEGQSSRVIKYVIREVNNHLSGVDYSKASPIWVKVTVTDDQQGKLINSVEYYADAGFEQKLDPATTTVKFENTYDAQDTTFTPKATKVLKNRQMVDREFAFVVMEGTTVVSTGWSKADGTVEFTPIGYTAAGEHTYTISEVKGNLPQVTYTDVTYTLKVTVVDDTQAGRLVAAGVYEGLTEGEIPTFTNTYTPSPTSVQLHATKKLENHAMVNGSFSFVVRDKDNNIVATGGNAAAAANETAAITFSNIGFTHAMLEGATTKDFIYSITEQPTTHDGVTIDDTVYYAKVTLTLNSDGTLSTAVSYYTDDQCRQAISGTVPAFVNVYEPDAAEVTLYADKTLINKNLQAEEFTFTLTGNGVVKTARNDANGRAAFEKLIFSAPGVYEYVISEAVTNNAVADRYTLDNSFKAIVTVEDDLRGKLIATVIYQELTADGAVNVGGAEFINHYTAPALTKDLSVEIGAAKTVQTPAGVSHSLAGFKFMVTDTTGKPVKGRDAQGNVVDIVGESNAEGKITFPSFYFTSAGEYHYWITEQPSGKTGVTDDPRSWEVHILVRYNDQTGLLYVSTSDIHTYPVGRAASGSAKPVFVNVYEPNPIKLTLTATKILQGRELKDREFLFYLMEGDRIVAQGYNDVSGTVKFELTYTAADIGTHNYKIKELIPEKGLGGVSYDSAAYTAATVTVSHDETANKLVASIGGKAVADGAVQSTGVTITNKYAVNSTSVEIHAQKVLTGGKLLQGNDYTFTLTNKDNDKQVYTAKNDAEGNVVFNLNLTEVGAYTYILAEAAGTDANITYDKNTYTVTVKITDDLQGNLKAMVAYDTADGSAPTFNNVYTPGAVTVELTGEKKLSGREMEKEEFKFEVRDSEDNVAATARNDAEGKLVFSAIELKTAGKYVFTVSEVKGGVKGMTYDDTEYTVTVEVVNDNGVLKATVTEPEGGLVFKNTYKEPDPTNPGTGDETPLFLLVGLMAVTGGAAAALLLDRKKRRA